MSGELPEITPRMARMNFLNLAEALGGLTPGDEKFLESKPMVVLW